MLKEAPKLLPLLKTDLNSLSNQFNREQVKPILTSGHRAAEWHRQTVPPTSLGTGVHSAPSHHSFELDL